VVPSLSPHQIGSFARARPALGGLRQSAFSITEGGSMMSSQMVRKAKWAWALALTALGGCSDRTDPVPRVTGPNLTTQAAWDMSAAAAQRREAAVAGVRQRGEQDEMLKLEAQLPGFGGFFIDSLGEVVLYLKPSVPGAPAAAAARAVIDQAYRGRPEIPVREVMAPASRAQVREARYSLSELIAAERRIAASPVRIPGYAGVGVSLFLNRVKVGFRREEDLAPGVDAIVAAGVPRDAIVPEVWGQAQPSGTWADYYRPTRGGLKVMFRTNDPFINRLWGTHGYVVATALGSRFFVAAHLPNQLVSVNGATGADIYQPGDDKPYFLGNLMGDVERNPSWTTSCGFNPGTGQPYDFCTSADVALGTFVNGATGDRRIGTSDEEGYHGAIGTQTINNWYPISGVKPPEFINQGRNIIHKSGATTGTTTGFIDLPCAEFPQRLGWDGVPSSKVLLLQCHVRVSTAGWGFGDSGAPVFAREVEGGPYYALGIMVTGLGTTDWTGKCSSGNFCAYVFAKWSKIEEHLGIGPISPVTP
jgi:hypothetical protein